jgi:hypothetical protein
MFWKGKNGKSECLIIAFIKKKPLWPESTSELSRLNDRHLLEKLVRTFADRGVSLGQRDGSPMAVI